MKPSKKTKISKIDTIYFIRISDSYPIEIKINIDMKKPNTNILYM